MGPSRLLVTKRISGKAVSDNVCAPPSTCEQKVCFDTGTKIMPREIRDLASVYTHRSSNGYPFYCLFHPHTPEHARALYSTHSPQFDFDDSPRSISLSRLPSLCVCVCVCTRWMCVFRSGTWTNSPIAPPCSADTIGFLPVESGHTPYVQTSRTQLSTMKLLFQAP